MGTHWTGGVKVWLQKLIQVRNWWDKWLTLVAPARKEFKEPRIDASNPALPFSGQPEAPLTPSTVESSTP